MVDDWEAANFVMAATLGHRNELGIAYSHAEAFYRHAAALKLILDMRSRSGVVEMIPAARRLMVLDLEALQDELTSLRGAVISFLANGGDAEQNATVSESKHFSE